MADTRKLYQVEILNSSLNKVAEIINLYPLDKRGNIIKYSNELSHWGTCTFRVSTQDPILENQGDVLIPHQYHIRIRRKGAIVWQGAIIDNPSRNRLFIEVQAAQYLFYFDKKRVKQDSSIPTGWPSGQTGWDNYRYFATGSMSTAVTNIVTEMKDGFGAGHILNNMTIGTIANPDYPNNFTNPTTGSALTGAWAFSTDVIMQFDYHSILHILKSFGAVASCDFELDNTLTFNFKPFLGRVLNDIGFTYGTFGNIINYDVPRHGERMVNDYMALATDSKGTLLKAPERDTESISTYGLMESSTAFSDVININILRSRVREELRYLKDPDSSPVNLMFDDRTYTIGTWAVGDIVNVKINDNIIDFNSPRRIVGLTVVVHNTGKEIAHVQTNKPRDNDLLG